MITRPPLTQQARQLFADRKSAAKWVIAKRYLDQRNLIPYTGMECAGRIVSAPRRAV